MPSFLPSGKVGGLQILRCQWLAVNDDSFAIDALTLEPSDFCNDGVNCEFKAPAAGFKLADGLGGGHKLLSGATIAGSSGTVFLFADPGRTKDTGRITQSVFEDGSFDVLMKGILAHPLQA